MGKEKSRRNGGNIPCLAVSGENLPEAWEKAILAVNDRGIEIATEYDKPEDRLSLDATVMIEVRNPLVEPRIHKNFPGGPAELEIYRQEVVNGIHNHWINPREGKWTYTYHERLFEYQPTHNLKDEDSILRVKLPGYGEYEEVRPVNQIEWMVEKLSRVGYSRRAQATTWMPTADPRTDDPPCLQRLWARVLPDNDELVLNMNSHWRSRDLYKAWFMNAFAFTDLQRIMAEQLSEKTSRKVKVGRYMDISDSLHIYGSYRNEDFEAEIEKMNSSPYTERAWDTSVLEPMFEETRRNLEEDPDFYAKGNF